MEFGGSGGEESACNVGDPGLIPGLERSPGEGNGYNSVFLSSRLFQQLNPEKKVEKHTPLKDLNFKTISYFFLAQL